MTTALYRDRAEGGRSLVPMLTGYANRADVVVLALARGGVPVGYQVAVALGAPLDVFAVRKLGVPGHPELAMGAIASGGVRVINDEVVKGLGVSAASLESVTRRERLELARQEQALRRGRSPLSARGKIAILVDDGLATGSTMRAAALAVRQQDPSRIVVAVPIASVGVCDDLRREVAELVCGLTPEPFRAVSLWYTSFEQVSDEEVAELLERANAQLSR